MSDDTNSQTASDTLGDMGEALQKDAEATTEDIKDAGEWVGDKAHDVKEGVEKEIDEHT